MNVQRFSKVRACVFDAYGTLFDVHSAVGRHRARLGDLADPVSILWRSKQLEYTWLRSLMGSHADFWQVTADALDYALDVHDIDRNGIRDDLLNAYLALDCYPEVPQVLKTLKGSGLRLAILSNGSPSMLEAALNSAGLDTAIEVAYSVEEVGIYKPDPRTYQLACDRLEVAADEVSFQSSNAWDAVGAAAFGMNVAWINRFGQRRERLPFQPAAELRDLGGLPTLLGH
jgi:2-haloacid dehalogenase